MISLIWAMDKNWLVGKGDKLPWHFKEDLIYYKSKTAGKTVLMGDKSYFSLKSYYKDKPLPYGKIYVASLDQLELDDAIVVNDVISFLKEFPKMKNTFERAELYEKYEQKKKNLAKEFFDIELENVVMY